MRTRLKKGLSIEGICNAPTIQDWKLQVMARTVFDILWSDKEGILCVADDILESCYRDNAESRLEDIARLDDEIAKEKRKLDALVDFRIEGEITKEDFSERQLAIKRDISSIESEIMRLKTIPQMDGVDVEEKMTTLKGVLGELVKNVTDETRQANNGFPCKEVAGSAVVFTCRKRNSGIKLVSGVRFEAHYRTLRRR